MKIESRLSKDTPWQTEWAITVDRRDPQAKKFIDFIVDRVNEALYDWQQRGGHMQPSEGEYYVPSEEDGDADGWGWTEQFAYQAQYIIKGDELTFSIFIDNEPDDKFDALDPGHPDFYQASPMQWLKVAAVLKPLIN